MSRQTSNFDELLISEYWRLCDELTVKQATMLIVGQDPASEIGTDCERWKEHERPPGYEAVKQALISSLKKGRIKGEHTPIMEYDINGNECGERTGTTDVDRSCLDFDSLVAFLDARNLRPPFFFPPNDKASGEPDYFNRNHPRHSFKLEAAVRVWLAMEDENLLRGKTPISAMTEWLETRYKELDLVHGQDNHKSNYRAGDRNNGAIETLAKIANWKKGALHHRRPKLVCPPKNVTYPPP